MNHNDHNVLLTLLSKLFPLSNQKTKKDEIISIICSTFSCTINEIQNLSIIKKGMTNSSFSFHLHDQQYLMRIPGKGTEKLIRRQEEYIVYQNIAPLNLCDDIFYLNPQNGYKISLFFPEAKNCDCQNWSEVKACMHKLRKFHESRLQVPHVFDLFAQIEYYEHLWLHKKSLYPDYEQTKTQILALKAYITSVALPFCLCHIDSVADNFIFIHERPHPSLQGKSNDPSDYPSIEPTASSPLTNDQQNLYAKTEIRLIDWEYAAMQDPHVDIAMFAIYSGYTLTEIDQLIQCYFPETCPAKTRAKIYAYIAICGLLWSNWCEYKYQLGVDFVDYGKTQYAYAKEFLKIFEQFRI
ncbi:hypothetical protein FACS189418_1840 [Clostridia bacterium]|nr:hypothetical protein FACS189418_1840 [Clostridia bacterium]